MANGKQKILWDHTCEIVAALINAHRSKNAPLLRASNIHPMRKTPGGMPFDGETLRAISESLKARETCST